jgi:hypothetical protein
MPGAFELLPLAAQETGQVCHVGAAELFICKLNKWFACSHMNSTFAKQNSPHQADCLQKF